MAESAGQTGRARECRAAGAGTSEEQSHLQQTEGGGGGVRRREPIEE